jgi:NADPH:quinone reductase-like Zn-dependent oxidoreductase
MKAGVLHEVGGSPRFEDFDEPVPGDGEVLVHVAAAALKPIDRQIADGSHYYAERQQLPAVCGADGVGRVEGSGERLVFNLPRIPFGGMAERTVAPRALCVPVPDGVDDVTAAAVFNPGMAAWSSLLWRGEFEAGGAVLVLGATGVSGTLAVQLAARHGARRVVAAGRDQEALARLGGLGADALVRLDAPADEVAAALSDAAGPGGYDLVIDYVWGPPTEALLAALTRSDMAQSARTRLVQVGQGGGPTISLPAAALRSSGLEIVGQGTGRRPPMDQVKDAYDQLMGLAGKGELQIDVATAPLSDVESVWRRPGRSRVVFLPGT